MHDARTRLGRDVERDVREHFPGLVFDTVIPRNVRLSEAPSFGVPVILHDPYCAGSEAYVAPRARGGGAWSLAVGSVAPVSAPIARRSAMSAHARPDAVAPRRRDSARAAARHGPRPGGDHGRLDRFRQRRSRSSARSRSS